ncbi:MAG: class I SAM-dependent methyltransferase [Flavobacteriaceae bacterium]|nr:class I SAM-dependent methyltransferase [Flavobacteriaceae bacterium]
MTTIVHQMMIKKNTHEASFRDPSGYLFYDQAVLRRSIQPIYFPQYAALKERGFFDSLIQKKLLIPHTETSISDEEIIITPEKIPFVTNPYEWSFEQYKQAALLTLKIQNYALSKGFILKDASAYNVTFHMGKPTFIDTLSFDFYREDTPWRAYKQFITHFLGPLVLAKYHGAEMLKMMQTHIDGLPIQLISSLLPSKTRLNSILYPNIHLLAKMERKYSDDYKNEAKSGNLSKKAHENILTSLYDYISKLKQNNRSEWGDYYSKTNYNSKAFLNKKKLVKDWVLQLKTNSLIDIGGNDGTFARTVIKDVANILVTDIDSNAIDLCYNKVRENDEVNLLPFVCDILQPPAGIGFCNTERESLIKRLINFSPDVTLALALIHHLTLSGNVPFEKSAAFFASFSKNLIIEFPKREDSWVKSLLIRKREFINHFDFYDQDNFEAKFGIYFILVHKVKIEGTHRIMYLYKKK